MGKCLSFCHNLGFLFILGGLVLFFSLPAIAAPRQMENLSRGLVASNLSQEGILVSWRLLGTESPTTEFNLYRDGEKIASIGATEGTNYLDSKGKVTSKYTVAAVVDGIEGPKANLSLVYDKSISTNNLNVPYKTLKVSVPAAQRMPDGENCTYTPNDMSTADLDGDGELELVLKWDPSNAHDNSQTGYTGEVFVDAYELDGTQMWRINLGKNIRAGAHYTQFQVFDYDGDGKAEIVMKTSDGTVDGKGNVIGDANKDYRNTGGVIISGKEYLTVFAGETGENVTTIDYVPSRSIQAFSKNSGWRDDWGNRSERYLATSAYLDGVHPSVVMVRGYYSPAYVVAYDFDGKQLKQRWFHKSEKDGEGLYGQGNHNIFAGDIDSDGYDEIIFGAAALNHDGTLRYTTKLGHGDAGHLSDLDPDRKGLEFWDVHEDKNGRYGDEMRLPDGSIAFGSPSNGKDNGRGLAADVDPARGFEMWSSTGSGTYNAKTGKVIYTQKPPVNFRIYFDGDEYDELLDNAYISKWNYNSKSAESYFDGNLVNSSTGNNGTKATPCLVADLTGDWREELVARSSNDPSLITIFSTPVVTKYRLYTLMHDPTYRMAITMQNTAYNQPPHLGYYLPDAIKNLKKPDIYVAGKGANSIVDNPIDEDDSNSVLNDGKSELDASSPKEGLGVFEATNVGFLEKGYYNFENNISSYGIWEIFSPKNIKTTLKIRYANGGTTNRDMLLSVNDKSVGSISFSSGSWTAYEEVSFDVILKAGVNTIKLASLSSDGGPNVDMFTFMTNGIEIYDGTQKIPVDFLEENNTTYFTSVPLTPFNTYNPHTGLLRTNRAGMVEIYVIDMRGNLVGSIYKDVQAGVSAIKISSDLLAKGVYMTLVKLNGKVISKQKFLKK